MTLVKAEERKKFIPSPVTPVSRISPAVGVIHRPDPSGHIHLLTKQPH